MAGAAFGILAMGIVEASAGGFAIREESSYFQGMSFAGAAAGGALSSMFWNPATMTQHAGINVEGDVTAIFPYAANTPAVGSTLLVFGGTGDTGDNALVPAAYASWQVSSNIWLGVSFNAPFGLSVSFPDLWAGRNYAQNTSLKTYDATPTIAVRLNDWISFGAGVSEFEGFFGQASFQTSNFLGRGESLTLSAQAGSRAQNYSLAFTEPFLFDRNITGGANIFRSEVRYIGQFTQESTGAVLSLGAPIGRGFTRMFTSYSYERVRVTDINEAYLNPEIFTHQFYNPAVEILGPHLSGFVFEQEYQPKKGTG